MAVQGPPGLDILLGASHKAPAAGTIAQAPKRLQHKSQSHEQSFALAVADALKLVNGSILAPWCEQPVS